MLYVNIFLVTASAYLLVQTITLSISLYQIVVVNVLNAIEFRNAKRAEILALKKSLAREVKLKSNGLMFDYEEDSIPAVDEFPSVEEEEVDVISLYDVETSR